MRSGRASTTTYVSAAARRTPTEARARAVRPDGVRCTGSAGRRTDLDAFVVVEQLDGVGLLAGRVERAGENGAAQLPGLGVQQPARMYLGVGIVDRQHGPDEAARQDRVDLIEYLAVDAYLVSRRGPAPGLQQPADALFRVDEGARIAETQRLGVDRSELGGERQLGPQLAVERDHVDGDAKSTGRDSDLAFERGGRRGDPLGAHPDRVAVREVVPLPPESGPRPPV